ncbi:4-hydroxythreonine-4-phosphate dehydrogenase PdxA [Candidatus Pelagibacter sp.]|nr:4-hydroxythreonine-4-phosphate dehydrogenase PdxA [Candidatus Pelagibacter sp.]
MSFKPILIVPGEKKSIFFEIFFKSLKSKSFSSPLILICDKKDLIKEIKKHKFNYVIEQVRLNNINFKKFHRNRIYVSHVKNQNSYMYVHDCFKLAFRLIKEGLTHKMINGPINKTRTLKKKYLGMTEFTAKNFNIDKFAMLIYNRKLSVCPITTHLPIKSVSKKITKKNVKDKIIVVNNFYKKYLRFKPRIAVTGLNPHCESISKLNEDTKIVGPVIKSLKNKINVKGPFSADTIFLKSNRKKFDVIIGMYHDQVLTPIKTIFEYDAINITMGLPFLRVTPDHGPNEKMIGKNISNPISLIRSLEFLDKK